MFFIMDGPFKGIFPIAIRIWPLGNHETYLFHTDVDHSYPSDIPSLSLSLLPQPCRGTVIHPLGSSNNLSIIDDATEGTSDCSDVVCFDEFRWWVLADEEPGCHRCEKSDGEAPNPWADPPFSLYHTCIAHGYASSYTLSECTYHII